MRLRDDERASLAINIIFFFATLVIGAILYILLEPMGQTFLNVAGNRTSTQAATQGQQYVGWTFESMHILVISVGLVQLIAAAVYQGRVR